MMTVKANRIRIEREGEEPKNIYKDVGVLYLK
jgi:hypothetical protein